MAARRVPVISGGTPITGWTIYDTQKNIYVADVPAAAVNSRQFYVDGEHQTRAMTEQSPTDWTLFGTKGYMSPAVTTQEANEYLVLDLGKVRSVNYLTAYSSIQADKNGRAAGFPQDFTVETSEDGTAWTVQCEQTGYESPVVATAATFNFAPAQARYIKLNATKLGTASRTNPGRYMLAISELETGLKTGSNTDLSEVVVDYDTNLMTAVEVLGHNENHDWNWLNQTGYGSANLFDNNPDTVVTTGGYYRQQIEVEGVYPWLSTNISQNGQNAEIAAIRIAVDAINQPVDFTIEISQSNDPGNTPDQNTDGDRDLVCLALRVTDEESANALLDTLASDNATATFLFSEEQLSSLGDLLRRVVISGNAAALRIDASGGSSRTVSAIERANNALWAACNEKARLVALYGASDKTLRAVRAAGYCPIDFDLDYSGALPTAAQAASGIARQARSGGCIAYLGADTAVQADWSMLLSRLRSSSRLITALNELALTKGA